MKTGDRVLCRGKPGTVVRVIAMGIGGSLEPLYAVACDDGTLCTGLAEHVTALPGSPGSPGDCPPDPA